MRFNTALLHSAKLGDENTGATLTPIYQSSAFYQPSAEQHEKLFHNKATGYSYTRINNPTIVAFEERMTNLEKGADTEYLSRKSQMHALEDLFSWFRM